MSLPAVPGPRSASGLFFAAAWSLVWALAGTARAADPPIPVEHFFSVPAVTGAKLSPSGKLLGVMVAGPNGRAVLGTMNLEQKEKSRIVADFGTADVYSFHWLSNQRLMFNGVDLTLEPTDRRGSGWLSVDVDGSELRPVYGSGGRLHTTLRDGSEDIVVEKSSFTVTGELVHVALVRVNPRNAQTTTLTRGAPDGAWGWVLDAKGEPRAVVAAHRGVERVYWRDDAAASWTMLEERPQYDAAGMHPVAIDAAGTLYVVARRGDAAGTTALFRYDPVARQREAEPIVAVSGFDFQGHLVFDDRHRLLGVRYWSDAEGTLWLDPAWRELQERIDGLLPATVNRLVCERCETSSRVLVRSVSDRQSPVYWLYDRDTHALTSVGAERPWLDPKAMAQRNFVRIKARDGLEVPMYVTQPRGKGPWPAVVLVHGGPWMRGGDWEWDAESQFLASRGYLVLQPEFRGSDGFGLRHLQAGFKQWGLAMQDDIADAALWAVQQGLADRARICIAGGSYGGYATLMGLVRHPDLYRCGVEWLGVTDIEFMYTMHWSDLSPAWLRYGMPVLVGDRDKDAAQLEATSPLKQAAKIRQPLLLAYGGSDRRVPIQHGTRFRDAVTAHNRDVEWIDYPSEGHGFALAKNRIDFWTRVEKFLARHLQASPTTAAPPPPTPGS
ncbi:MAG: alpha/beta hydrolase family protein [Rhizobacter sp.]